MPPLKPTGRLEEQDRDQLLVTARRLLAEADALSSRVAAVNEIGIAINSTLDLNAILKVIGRQAKWLLDFEHSSVCLEIDGSWKAIVLFGPALDTSAIDLLATENAGKSLRTRQPQLVREGSPSPFLTGYASQIIIPLVADDAVLGTINFASTEPRRYTQDDMRISYMLALQLASAIRNSRNFEELKRARDELRKHALELEERNEELDAFGHTIAHDLKSPLSNIVLKSEMAAMRYKNEVPEKVLETLNSIGDTGMHMASMIDQLLLLARLHNANEAVYPVVSEPVAKAAVARFAQMLETAKITVSVAPQMPIALAHAQWMEEVFANLVSNAIKYMGTASPAPRIDIRGSLLDDGTARFEVQDTGLGIAEADQSRLFEMFTRLRPSEAEGLGLGLSIVHRIVTRLKGKVGVESTPGVGSTFWFTLPAAPVVEASPVTNSAGEASIPV